MPNKSPLLNKRFTKILLILILGAILLLSTFNYGWANGVNFKCCPDETDYYLIGKNTPLTSLLEVKDIQEGLKKLGFYSGKLTGIYDSQTKLAVQKFQLAFGLQADGIVGRKTREKLNHQFEVTATNTKKGLRPKGIVELVVDVDKRKLIVYDGNKKFKVYNVAVGKDDTPSPIGEWTIKRKSKNWGTGFGTRWLGLDVTWGLYGIHGTNKPWSIGGFESHGCIRMFNRDVEELYEWVKVGTKVKIVGKVYSPYYEERNKIHKGHKGAVVVLIQKGLIAEGYLKGKPDGIFGQATEDALKKLQKDRGFEVTGQVDTDIWPVLGL